MVSLTLMLPVSSSNWPLRRTNSQDKKANSYSTRSMVTPYSPFDILLYCVLYFLVLLILRFWLLCRVTFLRYVIFSCSFLIDSLFVKSVFNASRATGLGFLMRGGGYGINYFIFLLLGRFYWNNLSGFPYPLLSSLIWLNLLILRSNWTKGVSCVLGFYLCFDWLTLFGELVSLVFLVIRRVLVCLQAWLLWLALFPFVALTETTAPRFLPRDSSRYMIPMKSNR